MPSKKVFIDTNVWFSAFYGSKNSEKVVKAHLNGKVKAIISQLVLEELIRNVKRKIPHKAHYVKTLLNERPPKIIRTPIKIPKSVKTLAHPKDQKILTSAIKANVSFFVTGNTKDFKADEIKKKM